MAPRQPIRKPSGPGAAARSAPEIPDKLYFRIGEVARLCEVPAYVLRFWETEFPQLRPNKGGTGQRLFRRRDVEMAIRIKRLLYEDGYTIPGARLLLKSEAKQKEPQLSLLAEDPALTRARTAGLDVVRKGLQELLRLLNQRSGVSGAAAATAPQPRSARAEATGSGTLVGQPANECLFDFPTGAASKGDRESTPSSADTAPTQPTDQSEMAADPHDNRTQASQPPSLGK